MIAYEECLPQCAADLDIPTLMRSYMYAFGYNSPYKAQKTLDYLDLVDLPCNDSTSCSINRSSGFNIKAKYLIQS